MEDVGDEEDEERLMNRKTNNRLMNQKNNKLMELEPINASKLSNNHYHHHCFF